MIISLNLSKLIRMKEGREIINIKTFRFSIEMKIVVCSMGLINLGTRFKTQVLITGNH